jgi:hypothetical protein
VLFIWATPFRSGNLGEAILAYRQAQRRARGRSGYPRQSRFRGAVRRHRTAGAQAAGGAAARFQPRGMARVRRLLLLQAGALAVWIAWPRLRFAARPAAAVLAALLLLALAGLALHRDLDRTPEGVVMLAGQKVLSSPLETATPLLAVPEGALVRMRENRGTWVEVEIGETRGWLPAAALAPVR